VNQSLTVFTLPECVQSTMTKRALDDAGLEYVVVDLATNEEAISTVQHLGYTATPIVIVGDASWSGFRPDKIRAVAAARATEQYEVPVDPMDELRCDSCQ
jgi:glutaredoxin-like protein NrdH